MSSHAKTRLQLLFWGMSAALVPLPAELSAQSAAHQPPRTLGAWIEETRASPFHDPMVSGALANPAAGLAVDVGAGVPDMVWPPMTPSPESPDSAVSFGKVFGYTLVAAFVPMVSRHDQVWFHLDWRCGLVPRWLGGHPRLCSCRRDGSRNHQCPGDDSRLRARVCGRGGVGWCLRGGPRRLLVLARLFGDNGLRHLGNRPPVAVRGQCRTRAPLCTPLLSASLK